MHKVLITGAAGFVGRHFTRRFLERGDEVHAVDPIVPGSGAIDPNCGWPLFEPRDHARFQFHREDCREFFRRVGDDDFDYCLHLAAIVGGRAQIERHPLAVAEDLEIDSAYWRWAVRTRPAKTLYFSSSAAYPVKYQQAVGYRLLREEMIDLEGELGAPDMLYGWAKLTGEYLALLAYRNYGLKSVVYRPFSGYGEDQGDAYPFPSICKRALAGRGQSVLHVWGTGEQMRDFIHIDDCVDAVLHTMDRIDDAAPLNLSTGIYTSFRELAGMAAELCGYSPQIVGLTDQPAGVFARGGDTTRQRQLGCTPHIDLRTGIARALAHYSSRPPVG